jgi:hypothetical protein
MTLSRLYDFAASFNERLLTHKYLSKQAAILSSNLCAD